MSQLFCQRPHERFVDFETSRFVVAKSCGLDVSTGRLEMGDEVPAGVLDGRALRQLYEPPLRRIELFDYAMEVPDLRASCVQRGTLVKVEAVAKPEPPLIDPVTMTLQQMVAFCQKNGIRPDGSRRQLRARIETFLA